MRLQIDWISCERKPGFTVNRGFRKKASAVKTPMANHTHSRPRALEGVRIIDLTWLQVGPQATRILASFGAQVIRIEWRKRGALDFPRYFQPFAPNHATPDGGR